MPDADGTTVELIRSAREFLALYGGDSSPSWQAVRRARGDCETPNLPDGAKLRPYQDACVLGTLAHWGTGKKEKVHHSSDYESTMAAVSLPTGTGKSWVISVLAVAMAQANLRVLVVTPSLDIRAGLQAKLTDFASFSGLLKKEIAVVVAKGTTNLMRRSGNSVVEDYNSENFRKGKIVLSNYQTLTHTEGKRMQVANTMGGEDAFKFNVVLIDEAHHEVAESYKRLLERCLPEFVCSLSATPINAMGTLVPSGVEYTLTWAMEHVPPYVAVPRSVIIGIGNFQEHIEASEDPDVTGNIPYTGKIPETQLQIHRAIAARTFEEVCHLRSLSGQPHFALAKAPNIAQADQLKGIYGACKHKGGTAGGYVEVLHTELPLGRQNAIHDRLDRGEIMVCVVVGKLSEGYDNQLISVLAWHCTTNSPTVFYQFLGRGLRRLEFAYLQKNGILSACCREDKRDDGLRRWPIVGQNVANVADDAALDEEQECVMIFSPESYTKMSPLMEQIKCATMKTQRNILPAEKHKRVSIRDAMRAQRARLLKHTPNNRSEMDSKKRIKCNITDEERKLRRAARMQKKQEEDDLIQKGIDASSIFDTRKDQSVVSKLDEAFEKWQLDGEHAKDVEEWQMATCGDPGIRALWTKLEQNIEAENQNHWWCHLYRRGVADQADGGGGEVNHGDVVEKVVLRWRRAVHCSPVLRALLKLTMGDDILDRADANIRTVLGPSGATPLLFNVRFTTN